MYGLMKVMEVIFLVFDWVRGIPRDCCFGAE